MSEQRFNPWPDPVDYCPRCGLETTDREVGGRVRGGCRSCGYVHMGTWLVGVGGVVTRHATVLLARRAIPPAVGAWAIPGGYVEADETLEVAVAREVREETGIETAAASLLSVRSVVNATHHDTYVAFKLEYIDGEATADGVENDDVGWFSEQDLDSLTGLSPYTKLLVGKALGGATGLPRTPYTRPGGELADCFAVATLG